MTRSSLQQKNIKAKFIAYDFSRAVTFGVVLYGNQWLAFFAELHIGRHIRYKYISIYIFYTFVGNYFLQCNKIKRIMISFDWFS